MVDWAQNTNQLTNHLPHGIAVRTEYGSEGHGFDSQQSPVWFFSPDLLLPKVGTAIGPRRRLRPHSRASSTPPPKCGAADVEIKVPSDENTELKSAPFKLNPGVGQYIAMRATLTARDFFFANFYPSGPFTCIFFQNLSRVFPVLAVTNTGCCVDPQNKIGHPVGYRFPCWVLVEYK